SKYIFIILVGFKPTPEGFLIIFLLPSALCPLPFFVKTIRELLNLISRNAVNLNNYTSSIETG
ncbi:MAG: hypothetical protein PUP92_40130, partial [Rhizonema sp. PD38]|nr:hypothetical protein [Rhizonema sp. PD38]